MRQQATKYKTPIITQADGGLWLLLSPSIHKFNGEFLPSGLSAVRQAHRPELIEGLREHYQASLCVVYITVFANRSTKLMVQKTSAE